MSRGGAFYGGRMRNRAILRFVLTFLIFIAGLFLMMVFGSRIMDSRVWYGDEPLYILAQFVYDNYLLLGFIAWFIISIFLAVRPYRDMEKVTDAARNLARPTETPIELPRNMTDIENELNRVRENALYNERAAREAEQKKDDLIVYLAHDLKTPLTSVIGYLSLLQDEPDLPKEMREKFVNIAYDKSVRLEDLINEFFEIARFNLSRLTLEESTIDLSLMLEQITHEFTPMLLEKGLTWDTDIQRGVRFTCDPDKLERLFDNLFRNAVNYSYADSPISVRMAANDAGIEVTVSNRGKTIPKDKLERIFEQFYRIDPSRGTKSGGSGLGLAIAKEMAELHGGRIIADSRDETVVFTVLLPEERVKP
jgi:two-component system sensor histidine kinase VanS